MLSLQLLTAAAAALAPATVTAAGHDGAVASVGVKCLRTEVPCKGRVDLRVDRGRLLGTVRFRMPAGKERRLFVPMRRRVKGGVFARVVIRMRGYRPRDEFVDILRYVDCRQGEAQLETATTRVFVVRGRAYFACHRGGEPYRLADHADLPSETADHFTTAGDLLAYATTFSWKSSFHRILVVDLRTRRTVVAVEDVGPSWSCSDLSCSAGPVTDVAVAPSGWVAWIVRSAKAEHEVRAVRPGGARIVLDTGAGIEPASLEIEGERATWTHAGERRAGAPG